MLKTPASRLAVLLIALSCLPSLASAAPVVYFGDDSPKGSLANSNAAFNSFVATLSTYGVDTIEGLAPFTPDPELTFGATGIKAQTDVNFVAPFGAVSGIETLYDAGPAAPGGADVPDTFTFNQLVTAFGFYASNVGDGVAPTPPNTVTLILENTLLGTSEEVVVGTFGPDRPGDATFFFGVTDVNPFNKVTMHQSFDYDGTLLDNVTAGQVAAVPEAGSVALIAAASALAFVVRRRSLRSTR